jgi:hypothetical protein
VNEPTTRTVERRSPSPMPLLQSVPLLSCFACGPISNFLVCRWEVPTLVAPLPCRELPRRPLLQRAPVSSRLSSPRTPEDCASTERRGFIEQASRALIGVLSASLSLLPTTPLATAAAEFPYGGASTTSTGPAAGTLPAPAPAPAPTPSRAASGSLSTAKIQQLYRVIPDASPPLNPKLAPVTVRRASVVFRNQRWGTIHPSHSRCFLSNIHGGIARSGSRVDPRPCFIVR